ncbi:hypothetical protein AURDEDRAFT_121982 [Auricularia subglabra TFB-10046 SS5]|nr:hypothetical protein AURDEDRAFT_121982 [Auricularia subglabra TFB-10046 SS5]
MSQVLHNDRFRKQPPPVAHCVSGYRQYLTALCLVAIGLTLGLNLDRISSAFLPRSTMQQATSPIPPHALAAASVPTDAPGFFRAGFVSCEMPSFFDHAAFHNGARVVDSLTSANLRSPVTDIYTTEIADEAINNLVHGSCPPPSTPEIAIDLYSDRRALWFFKDSPGTLAVALPSPVIVRAIYLRAHSAARSCLPRDVNIWGLVVPPDSMCLTAGMLRWPDTEVPFRLQQGNRIKSTRLEKILRLFKEPSQSCWVPLASARGLQLHHGDALVNASAQLVAKRIPVHIIAVEFLINWGDIYTCFPGLGVEGYTRLDDLYVDRSHAAFKPLEKSMSQLEADALGVRTKQAHSYHIAHNFGGKPTTPLDVWLHKLRDLPDDKLANVLTNEKIFLPDRQAFEVDLRLSRPLASRSIDGRLLKAREDDMLTFALAHLSARQTLLVNALVLHTTSGGVVFRSPRQQHSISVYSKDFATWGPNQDYLAPAGAASPARAALPRPRRREREERKFMRQALSVPSPPMSSPALSELHLPDESIIGNLISDFAPLVEAIPCCK